LEEGCWANAVAATNTEQNMTALLENILCMNLPLWSLKASA